MGHKPSIPRGQFHELEAYYFRLVMYTDTAEFREDIKSENQRKIMNEIGYMEVMLDVLSKVFPQVNEKPVVAWAVDSSIPDYKRLFHFSCVTTASLALGCHPSLIASVCQGKKEDVGGYFFMYAKDYEKIKDRKIDGPVFYSKDNEETS